MSSAQLDNQFQSRTRMLGFNKRLSLSCILFFVQQLGYSLSHIMQLTSNIVHYVQPNSTNKMLRTLWFHTSNFIFVIFVSRYNNWLHAQVPGLGECYVWWKSKLGKHTSTGGLDIRTPNDLLSSRLVLVICFTEHVIVNWRLFCILRLGWRLFVKSD